MGKGGKGKKKSGAWRGDGKGEKGGKAGHHFGMDDMMSMGPGAFGMMMGPSSGMMTSPPPGMMMPGFIMDLGTQQGFSRKGGKVGPPGAGGSKKKPGAPCINPVWTDNPTVNWKNFGSSIHTATVSP